jgi:voltage-gated potassium channel
LDLAIVALPFLRPLRLLRLVVLVGALQRAFGDAFRGRVIVYTAYSALLLVYAASLAVLETERSDPRANIHTFGEALWWSVTTMGRVVAVLLMAGGISLIGMITATVATWIVQRVGEEDTAQGAATAARIEELRSQIAQPTNMVADQQKNRAASLPN